MNCIARRSHPGVASVSSLTSPHLIVSRNTGAVMRANESNFYFAIQQGQFAAKMTNGVRLRLFSRISEVFEISRELPFNFRSAQSSRRLS